MGLVFRSLDVTRTVTCKTWSRLFGLLWIELEGIVNSTKYKFFKGGVSWGFSGIYVLISGKTLITSSHPVITVNDSLTPIPRHKALSHDHLETLSLLSWWRNMWTVSYTWHKIIYFAICYHHFLGANMCLEFWAKVNIKFKFNLITKYWIVDKQTSS